MPQINALSNARDIIFLGPLIAYRTPLLSSSASGDTKVDYIAGRMRRLASYIYYLPPRSGHNPTLDDTIACAAAALRAVNGVADREKTTNAAWSAYGKALCGLRADLQSAERSVTAETLCTTELLSYCEVSFKHNLFIKVFPFRHSTNHSLYSE